MASITIDDGPLGEPAELEIIGDFYIVTTNVEDYLENEFYIFVVNWRYLAYEKTVLLLDRFNKLTIETSRDHLFKADFETKAIFEMLIAYVPQDMANKIINRRKRIMQVLAQIHANKKAA